MKMKLSCFLLEWQFSGAKQNVPRKIFANHYFNEITYWKNLANKGLKAFESEDYWWKSSDDEALRYDNIGIEKYASKVLIGYIKSSKLSQQFLENLVRFATSLLLFIQDKA